MTAVSGVLVVTGGVVTAASEQERLPDVLARADQLYKENKMPEALSYLRQFDTQEEAELLWRLARLCYKVRGQDWPHQKDGSLVLQCTGRPRCKRGEGLVAGGRPRCRRGEGLVAGGERASLQGEGRGSEIKLHKMKNFPS